jgi:aminoglycoside phosphotransferase
MELLAGVTILWQGVGHRIELHPGNIAVKCGAGIYLGEADALRTAESAGLPVPHVHAVGSPENAFIKMDYILGQSLDKVWKDMAAAQKGDIARQLRDILVTMRSVPPPATTIGACDGTGVLDSRLYHTYLAPVCNDEEAFNDYLVSGFIPKVPPAIRDAVRARLRRNHRMVLSHCDLSPRNIMVHDGKILALVDWEDAGWYPEYWEYAKFFHRNDPRDDWWCYAAEIFPEQYPDELVDYIAFLKWQCP